ncbi:hypothetical protein Hypma_004188 [Hypsizygus marmoreus]|uniref:Uncharacterized protein n=1 Tax=Hypsizygus marmoreus TaxID=39966 RepID=A0A369J6Z7_HYPMA|nr:hypothetical protein Hypma_004188 [Hypsizygus marmoreus]
MYEHPRWRRNNGLPSLASSNIPTVFNDALSESDGVPERAVVALMNKYTFSFPALYSYLEDNLEAQTSFSKLTSIDMSPYMNWTTFTPKFQVHRARLPTSVFKNIMSDIDILMRQFAGPMQGNTYVEEMSRWIAPIFNRIVSHFNSKITNTFESVMSSPQKFGTVKDRDRLVCHFKAFGIIVLVVIETTTMPSTSQEYSDCIAHLVAECDACDCKNSNGGEFHCPSIPIHAIITDGQQFAFFRFDPAAQPPVLYWGTLRPLATAHPCLDGSLHLVLDEGRVGYLCSFRPICEVVFYVVQLGFLRGMQSQYQRRVMRLLRVGVTGAGLEQDGDARAWLEADDVASDALDLGVQAAVDARIWSESADRDATVAAANDKASRAWDMIHESIDALPTNYKAPERKYSIMCDWDEERVDRA